MIGVTSVIAVDEMGSGFPQIAGLDLPIAHHTERLPAGRPAIHQDESHVAPPKVKQNTVSDWCETLGGGAQR